MTYHQELLNCYRNVIPFHDRECYYFRAQFCHFRSTIILEWSVSIRETKMDWLTFLSLFSSQMECGTSTVRRSSIQSSLTSNTTSRITTPSQWSIPDTVLKRQQTTCQKESTTWHHGKHELWREGGRSNNPNWQRGRTRWKRVYTEWSGWMWGCSLCSTMWILRFWTHEDENMLQKRRNAVEPTSPLLKKDFIQRTKT